MKSLKSRHVLLCLMLGLVTSACIPKVEIPSYLADREAAFRSDTVNMQDASSSHAIILNPKRGTATHTSFTAMITVKHGSSEEARLTIK